MSDRDPDGFTMIGLHKLAAQAGDGLVPELYEILADRRQERRSHVNVIAFPIWEARFPGEAPDAPLGADAADGRNVVAFQRPARKTCGHRKKV